MAECKPYKSLCLEYFTRETQKAKSGKFASHLSKSLSDLDVDFIDNTTDDVFSLSYGGEHQNIAPNTFLRSRSTERLDYDMSFEMEKGTVGFSEELATTPNKAKAIERQTELVDARSQPKIAWSDFLTDATRSSLENPETYMTNEEPPNRLLPERMFNQSTINHEEEEFTDEQSNQDNETISVRSHNESHNERARSESDVMTHDIDSPEEKSSKQRTPNSAPPGGINTNELNWSKCRIVFLRTCRVMNARIMCWF
ncbi:uncharacterized protein LOC120339544 [Styela clava]